MSAINILVLVLTDNSIAMRSILAPVVLCLAILGHTHPTASDAFNETLYPRDGDSTLEARGSCANGGGECVTYYSGQNCQNPEGSYVPTCKGNCFQYSSFSSLFTSGRTITGTGTDCAVYSDSNCQNKIADTGNHVSNQCTSFSTANSMKCYFNC